MTDRRRPDPKHAGAAAFNAGVAPIPDPGPARPRALDIEPDRRELLMPPDESHPGPWRAQVGRATADRIADRHGTDEPVPLVVTPAGRDYLAVTAGKVAAETVPCPECGAAPGVECSSAAGWPHIARSLSPERDR